jgi:hypothetical protein
MQQMRQQQQRQQQQRQQQKHRRCQSLTPLLPQAAHPAAAAA